VPALRAHLHAGYVKPGSIHKESHSVDDQTRQEEDRQEVRQEEGPAQGAPPLGAGHPLMRSIGSILFIVNIVLVLLHWHGTMTVPPWIILGLFFFGLLFSSQRPRTPPQQA
jgi:hypothetical protein